MKLFRLLQLDGIAAENCLSRNFGDSFLVRHNAVFRNIRNGALNCGFSFDANPNSSYLALPLSQLENIISSKKIPYVDNVEVLHSVEKKVPGLVEFYQIQENLRKNFVFHEACHAVARGVLSAGSLEHRKLNLLLEESFANTCELFGMLDANDAAHRIFYEVNSYTSLFEIKGNLAKLCADMGAPLVFQFFILGYLHSNFLFNSFSEKQFEAISKMVGQISKTGVSTTQLKSLRSLLKVCFTLDLDFRTTTTDLHLKLSGFPNAQHGSADFGYFDDIHGNEFYYKAVNELAQIALGGIGESK